jgi:hypothetical protein
VKLLNNLTDFLPQFIFSELGSFAPCDAGIVSQSRSTQSGTFPEEMRGESPTHLHKLVSDCRFSRARGPMVLRECDGSGQEASSPALGGCISGIGQDKTRRRSRGRNDDPVFVLYRVASDTAFPWCRSGRRGSFVNSPNENRLPHC